jgi:hypothetical protein
VRRARGRPNKLPIARCPNRLHRGSRVAAKGTRASGGRRVRSYLCTPLVVAAGEKQRHYFSVVIEDNRPVARWQPAPGCPDHPDGAVVRNGVYGAGKLPRQRYRCTPPGGKAHSFTPPLPREHISVEGRPCPHCEEQRGVHRGETSVARRHRFTTRTVVRGLESLSKGDPYTKVSLLALKTSGYALGSRRRRDHSPEPLGQVHGDTGDAEEPDLGLAPEPSSDDLFPVEPSELMTEPLREFGDEPDGRWDSLSNATPVEAGMSWIGATEAEWALEADSRSSASESSRQKRAAWRIGANWVDAFGPVIWEPIEARLRTEALAERARLDALIAAGMSIDRPQILMLDDVPVWGRSGKSKRRDGGFYLLVVAEVVWVAAPGGGKRPTPDTRFRLIRAMPKSNTPAWRLVFDELGYAPDFIVADGGTGIEAAIKAHFDPKRTTFIPSLWHAKNSIRRALGVDAVTTSNAAVDRHLRELARDGSAVETPGALAAWWDELARIASDQKLPVENLPGQRHNYEGPLRAVLPYLRAAPGIRLATGGLESMIRSEIDPVLVNRTRFANIVRTNQLFDLVVARIHGAFDDHAVVARQLRRDAEAYDGWTIALRDYDDPQPEWGRYSSLRDATLLASNAAARGLA